MWEARHCRFFFAFASVLLLWTAPVRAQSAAQQSPAAQMHSPKPNAQKAKKLYEKGLRAEQAEDWAAAFDAYGEAVTYAPDNAEALLRREAARFRLVQGHTDRAEREALAGRLNQARDDLRAALRLDPGYSVARERLQQFEPSVPPQLPQTPSYPEHPIQLQPQPGTRNFDHRGDVRGAYEAVARQFGLTATFDTDLPLRSVRFRVAAVDFETGMNLLSQQTGTLWRALDVHTFFVFENTPQKRREYVPVVVRTVILPASATPDKMTETMRLVREIAGVTHIDLDTRSRTLTLRDSPESVALAMALIQEIEQALGELMLEIEILEVDQNVARRLGITPPATARIITFSQQDIKQAQQSVQGLLQVVSRLFGLPASLAGVDPSQIAALLSSGQFGLATLVPPVVAFGGGRTTSLATLPGAAADFSEVFSVVRSGRRMLLRAQDGQPATFFIGERFPITLALLGAGLVSPQSIPGISQLRFPRTDFVTGTSPVAIATGDFKGDGKLDLAVVNKGSNTVSLLLGKGDGTFTEATGSPITVGQSPVAIASGDFNADGHPDLAVVNQTAGTVSIFLNKGDGSGTFNTGQVLTAGSGPIAVTAADFNADGHPDLAVVNQTAGTVSIFLNKGDGSGAFGPKTDFATGASPVSVATGDFNVDGRTDLVIANQTDNTVSVLLGNGNGQFSPRFDLAIGRSPSAVVAGDFNGDGRTDLATANQADNTVSVILNTAAFVPPGGAPQIAYPGSEYEDLGLKVRATPRIHADNEVTLRLEFEIRSLSGVTFNGIPVISNRTVQQTVRLRENETTVLSGIVQREETRAITGLPGFARVAAAGHLAGRRNTQRQDTELLIVITPRQLRLAPRTNRSIYAGREAASPRPQ